MRLIAEALGLRGEVFGLIGWDAALMDVRSYAQSTVLPLLQNQFRDQPGGANAVCEISTFTEKCRRPAS